jgi:hypothetical protein
MDNLRAQWMRGGSRSFVICLEYGLVASTMDNGIDQRMMASRKE